MGIICKREPSVDELLNDPMMPLVFDHDRITADDVRALVRDVAERRAATRASRGEEPLARDRSLLAD